MSVADFGCSGAVEDANVREHAVTAVVDVQPDQAAGCGAKFPNIECQGTPLANEHPHAPISNDDA